MSRGADVKQWLIWPQQAELQRGSSPLPLIAVSKYLFQPWLVQWPTAQVSLACHKLVAMLFPPGDQARPIGPAQVLIGIHFNVVIGRVLRWTGRKSRICTLES